MGMIWVGYRRDADEARAILEDDDRVEDLLDSDDGTTSYDLDKAWHGIHWLLTGSAEPTGDVLSDAVLGGEEVGDDLGYGAPRLLTAGRVADVADALAGVDADVLHARFDPEAMRAAQVYPDVWDREDDSLEGWLLGELDGLRGFYRAAATAEQAVIQTIC
jgi:hypothetical protein